MRSVELASYAKINLTLEIVARRTDGWHEIDSVVQVIDITDELSVSKASTGIIEVAADNPDVPIGSDNIVHKACVAFFENTGVDAGVMCKICKRIPMQAGLGGGSGNAAAVIIALDRLYETGLPKEALARIAAQVGADAALFVYGGTLRMQGIGEIIEPLPDAPELHLVVIKPEAGVSTPWAYAEIDRSSHDRKPGSSDAATMAIRNGNRDSLVRSLWNEFDEVVSRAAPEIDEAEKLLMKLGAQRAVLCGSGSAVFGVFQSADKAQSARDVAHRKFKTVFATRSLRRQEYNFE